MNKPMGFEQKPEGGQKSEVGSLKDEQQQTDHDGTPYCPLHFCRMKQYSGTKSGDRMAHFKCPVEGCRQTGKRVTKRAENAVPSAPTMCNVCKSKKPCEVDPDLSDATKIILRCVDCGHKLLPKATPALLEAQLRQRKGEG